ncbi:MAG: hypothetical protein ACIAQF_01535 [Phycisphaerales bacterium JB065]
MKRTILMVVCLIAALVLPACSGGGYQLQGRVIRGDYSAVMLVDADDDRLSTGEGIAGVALHVQQDPAQLNRRTLVRGNSMSDGAFALPIELIGAGTFHYDIGVFARRKGYEPTSGYFRLPPKSKRVLVVMNFGNDHDLGEEREDPYEDYERFKGSP